MSDQPNVPRANAEGRIRRHPAVVLHAKRLPGEVIGWDESEMATRIERISIGGVPVEVVGTTPLGLVSGPGPTSLTVTLLVGEVTMEYEE